MTNLGGVAIDAFHYILSAYMFVFGLVTAIIEANTDAVGTTVVPFGKFAEPIARAQASIHEEVRSLTTIRGRGFFYLHRGALMVSHSGTRWFAPALKLLGLEVNDAVNRFMLLDANTRACGRCWACSASASRSSRICMEQICLFLLPALLRFLVAGVHARLGTGGPRQSTLAGRF